MDVKYIVAGTQGPEGAQGPPGDGSEGQSLRRCGIIVSGSVNLTQLEEVLTNAVGLGSGQRFTLGYNSLLGSAKFPVSVFESSFDGTSGIYEWNGEGLDFIESLPEIVPPERILLQVDGFLSNLDNGLAGMLTYPTVASILNASGSTYIVAVHIDPSSIPIQIDNFTSENLNDALSELGDLVINKDFIPSGDLVVDEPEIYATHERLILNGLDGYMDGDGGFIKDAAGRLWMAHFMADEKSAFVPLAEGSRTEWAYEEAVLVPVENLPAGFLGSGGPIVDAGDGTGLMVLHLEADSYQKLGGAKVVMDEDGPVSVTYIGDLIVPHMTQEEAVSIGGGFSAFAGSGCHIHIDGYIYLYFNEWESGHTDIRYSVARCLEQDLLNALEDDEVPVFYKWTGGDSWSPTAGGVGADLGVDSPRASGSFLKLRDGRWLVMNSGNPSPTEFRLMYTFTRDGIHFEPYQWFWPKSSNEWYTGTLYSGDPDNPDTMTNSRAWFYATESDPNDRWGTSKVLRVPVRNWATGPGGGSGRHGDLSGLLEDTHYQYLTTGPAVFAAADTVLSGIPRSVTCFASGITITLPAPDLHQFWRRWGIANASDGPVTVEVVPEVTFTNGETEYELLPGVVLEFTLVDLTSVGAGIVWAPQNIQSVDGSLLDNSVTESKIVNGAVTTAKLNDDAVTSTKISDEAISDSHISSSANIGLSKLNISGTPDGSKFLKDNGSWSTLPAPPVSGRVIASARFAAEIGRGAGSPIAPYSIHDPTATVILNPGEWLTWSFTGLTPQEFVKLIIKPTFVDLFTSGDKIHLACYSEHTDYGPGLKLWDYEFNVQDMSDCLTGFQVVQTAAFAAKTRPSNGWLLISNPPTNTSIVTFASGVPQASAYWNLASYEAGQQSGVVMKNTGGSLGGGNGIPPSNFYSTPVNDFGSTFTAIYDAPIILVRGA